MYMKEYNVHLNVAERLWVAWYFYMQNDVLATGIMSFVMHELVYFGRSLPWIIIDRMRYFHKYKIQSVSPRPRYLFWSSTHWCRIRYLHLRSNGTVRNWYSSVTSQLNCPKFGMC